MKLKRIRDDTRGAALLEFTVTMPFFLLLIFGLVQAGLLLYTLLGLQHGVEVAARCASVNYSANQLSLSQSCFTGSGGTPTPSTVIADNTYTYIKQYAINNSWGIVPSASDYNVTMSKGAECGSNWGYLVSVTHSYNLINYIFKPPSLTAVSCFPINVS